jgi:hypothetical protein
VAVNFLKPEPHIVLVDGEPIRVHFTRMTLHEFEAFNAVFTAVGSGRTSKPTPAPPADGAPPVLQIAQLLENAAEGREHADWMLDVFERYVTIAPGDLLDDGVVVTSGRRFAELMVGQDGVLVDTLAGLWLEHVLTPAQKKTSRLLRGSATGSGAAPNPATPGVRPATAATSAGPEASVAVAGVTAPSRSASSGTTARRRSSGSARSGSSRRKPITCSASSTAVTRPS